jgi:hypothetical protein
MFPERFRFLKQELKLDFKENSCPEFEKFLSTHKNIKSLSLIYAAPYLGSPSSMFGHTFVRLNQIKNEGNETLNDTLSFEAFTGNVPEGVDYALQGVLGFFPGSFSALPYYLKMNLYTNMESRDLWEYEIPLSEDDSKRLLGHVWELGSTYFSYYFFDENCSYHLLALLELMHPEWHLRDHFFLMTIPADTLRVIQKESGHRLSPTLRPSILNTLQHRLSAMSSTERTRFRLLTKNPGELNEQDSTPVIDTVLDWQKYQAITHSKTIYDASKKIEQRALLLRATRNEKASENNATHDTFPPETGHGSSKAAVGLYSTEQNMGTRLEWRGAYHDPLDPDEGYLKNSLLTISRVVIEQDLEKTKTLRLRELIFAEVGTLAAHNELWNNFAWQAGLGFSQPRDLLNCDS